MLNINKPQLVRIFMTIYSIYRITNNVNGKVYIGITINVEKRMKEHRCCKKDRPLYRAIRKYGWVAFTYEIVAQTKDKDYAYAVLEPMMIKEHNSMNMKFGYNLTEGGEGTVGTIPSVVTRKRMSNARKGKTYEEFYGIEKALELKEQKRAQGLGKVFSNETKEKISSKLKGNKNFEGKTFTDEVKQKLSDLKSKTWTVIDPTGCTVTIHNMLKFCKDNGLHHSAMSKVIHGKQTQHKGWTAPTSHG